MHPIVGLSVGGLLASLLLRIFKHFFYIFFFGERKSCQPTQIHQEAVDSSGYATPSLLLLRTK